MFHENRQDIPQDVELWQPGESRLLCSSFFCFCGGFLFLRGELTLTQRIDWRARARAGEDAEKIDLVITLGGDGTILHASSLFKVGAVPPVLSFSMGTLGFLLPFRESASAPSRSKGRPADIGSHILFIFLFW